MKPVFPISHWESREVSRDSFVSYKGKCYSVPFRFAGKQVKIKESLDHHLEIFDGIAKHPL